jgi:hypothetical protein
MVNLLSLISRSGYRQARESSIEIDRTSVLKKIGERIERSGARLNRLNDLNPAKAVELLELTAANLTLNF